MSSGNYELALTNNEQKPLWNTERESKLHIQQNTRGDYPWKERTDWCFKYDIWKVGEFQMLQDTKYSGAVWKEGCENKRLQRHYKETLPTAKGIRQVHNYFMLKATYILEASVINMRHSLKLELVSTLLIFNLWTHSKINSWSWCWLYNKYCLLS